MQDHVTVPVSLLEKMAHAGEAMAAFEDALEDYLIANDPALLERIQKADDSRLAGRLRPFSEIRGDA